MVKSPTLKAINVHSKHISRYENEKTEPTIETLRKMAHAFGVTTDYLLFDNVPRNGTMKVVDPEFVEQFEKIVELNEEERKTIKNVIKAIIAKHQMEHIITNSK
jgi:transcriptional regulator with XRE-family HTH domain